MQKLSTKLTKKARLPVWRRLAWRLGASFLLVTAITILLSGFLQYRAQEQDLRETLGSRLLSIARTGALTGRSTAPCRGRNYTDSGLRCLSPCPHGSGYDPG